MKKRICLVLVLLMVIGSGIVFAQSNGTHFISGEIGLIGAGVRYEFMLTPQWSVGANVYWNSLFFFWNELGANAVGRFYPFSGMFYAELGAGFGLHTGISDHVEVITGFGLVPGVGWKIDAGSPGGFFVQPLIQLPLTFGNNDWENKFGVGVGIRVACGLGYAF